MMGTGDPSKAVTGHVARELLKLAFEKSMSKDDNTPFAIAATEVGILTRPRHVEDTHSSGQIVMSFCLENSNS